MSRRLLLAQARVLVRAVVVAACSTSAVASGSCATTRGPGGEGGGALDEPAAGTFRTLAPGETLWDLARDSGLSVEEIVEVNGLASADDVAPGQRIFLPAGGTPSQAPQSSSPRLPPSHAHERDEAPVPAGSAVLAWPVAGVVLRDFKAGSYDGLLVAAPAGADVVAAADGVVAFAGDQKTAYGVIVVVTHEELGLTTVYGHLDAASLSVKAGERVKRGAPLAKVGTSGGGAETPRLHFEARRGRTAIDPLTLLPP